MTKKTNPVHDWDIQKSILIMFDATQMPFYVKNNLILCKIDEKISQLEDR